MVLRTSTGPSLLIKGPNEIVHDIFKKEERKGGAIREGLMTGLLILLAHQKVLETFGWKGLPLLSDLYETGD